MEEKERPFEAIKIGMASVETAQQRYSMDEHTHPPIPAFWRVNLTALSQTYNLYFVAIGKSIQVFEPQFPFQKLGGKPTLTIVPQLSNTQATGYINSRHPHYINNLIIGQLGEQEVLLLTTDSGNVTGYETRAVVNAIRNYAVNTFAETASLSPADIRPFFSQWVVESAWGLSIHTKGRMIAVSANASSRRGIETIGGWEDRGSVTIFAFALTTSESDDTSETSIDSSSEFLDIDREWNIWNPAVLDAAAAFPHRHRNYKVILAGVNGHPTNVPYVSFFNTPEDQRGAWILSTDVEENVKLWHIWSGRCIKTWEFRDYGVSGAAWLGVEERGWIAATLDRRAFQPVSDTESLIGYHRAPQHYGFEGQGESFDITNVVQHHVPSNAHIHPLNESDDDSDSSSDGETMRLNADLSESGSVADDIDLAIVQRIRSEIELEVSSRANMSETTDVGVQTTDQSIGMEEYSDESSSEDNFEVQSDFSEGNASDHDVQVRPMLSPESTTSTSSYHTGNSSMNSGHDTRPSPNSRTAPQDNDVEMTTDQPKKQLQTSTATSTSQYQPLRIPDVPFIYCSSSHLRLFDSTNAKSPHLFCARFLKQAISTAMEDQGIIQMDRLDMVEQLPELGIVIIATQYGRCAICSLTKRNTDGLLGLRIDWILPTQKQEKAGLRPHMPLHGIAVSPIQRSRNTRSGDDSIVGVDYVTQDRVVSGVATTFDNTTLDMSDADQRALHDDTRSSHGTAVAGKPLNAGFSVKTYDWSKHRAPDGWTAVEGNRRYRLMMTYADMTVLTYEISRGVERADIRDD